MVNKPPLFQLPHHQTSYASVILDPAALIVGNSFVHWVRKAKNSWRATMLMGTVKKHSRQYCESSRSLRLWIHFCGKMDITIPRDPAAFAGRRGAYLWCILVTCRRSVSGSPTWIQMTTPLSMEIIILIWWHGCVKFCQTVKLQSWYISSISNPASTFSRKSMQW